MRRFAGWALGIAAVVAVIIVFRVDISAARFFESDAVVRNAFPGAPKPAYYDPSPYSLWLPSDWFVWDSLRSGHLPLWERLQGGGYSPVITFQNGVFHPLRWLVALAPRALAPSVLIALAVLLAAWGTWLLLLDLGRTMLAAGVGAALFALSSPLLENLHFSGDLLPLAHMPWLFLTIRRRSLAGSSIVIALLLMSGHPLYVVTVGIAAIGFAIAEASVLHVVLATLLGAGLAAFTYVPAIASMPDLWFYKTETHQGSVYALFDPWLHAVAAMFVDLRTPRSVFDDPEFWLYIGIPAAMLASFGLAGAMATRRDRTLAALLVLFFVLSVPGIWMLPIAMTKPLMYMNRSYFAGGMTFVIAVFAAAGYDRLRSRSLGQAIAVVCAIAAVAMYTVRAYEVLKPRRWREIVRGDIVAQLRRDPAHRIVGTLGQTHLPNSSRITGIEDARESTPVWTLRKDLWWRAVDPEIRRNAFPTFRLTDRVDSPLLGDFNVGWVLRSQPVAEPWKGLVRPRVHFVDRVLFVRNMDEAARALGVRAPKMLRAGLHVYEGTGAPANLEVVEWPGPPRTLPQPVGATAIVRYPSDSSAVIDIDSAGGGLVVLHDTFQRGWEARIDGKPVAIVPVNLISRGVMAPAGHHLITMAYLPSGFRTGLAISAAALLALLSFGLWPAPKLLARVDDLPHDVRRMDA
ncbi:MAG TPA: YfhO family protein [Thermoanaerobaculia bacterium]